MNIRRILISEQEKKSILGLYGVDNDLVNEQEFKIDSDGTYTVKYNQEFGVTGQQFGGSPSRIQIKKGTKIKPKDDKLVFNVYYGTVSGVYDKILTGSYTCGNTSIIVGTNQRYGQVPPPGGFISTISSLFCNGNKLKTDNKTVVNPQKDTTTKKCYTTDFTPTYNQICKLPNDNTWMYAKDDSGKWYTSRQTDTKKWCELVLPQYQKAVDTLVKGCPTTIEPIKLPIKPIDTTQPNQPEIQLDPKTQLKQNLNVAKQGLNYLQAQNNKGI
jgi:hypothetical protein